MVTEINNDVGGAEVVWEKEAGVGVGKKIVIFLSQLSSPLCAA